MKHGASSAHGMVSADFRYSAVGVRTVVASICLCAMGINFVRLTIREPRSYWSEAPLVDVVTVALIIAACMIFCFGGAYQLLRAGVFADGDTLVVKQLSRTRRFARASVGGAQIVMGFNVGRRTARLQLQLEDEVVTCQLYGHFLRSSKAEPIAESINRWCAEGLQPKG